MVPARATFAFALSGTGATRTEMIGLQTMKTAFFFFDDLSHALLNRCIFKFLTLVEVVVGGTHLAAIR